MHTIGIIGAMEEEIASIKEKMEVLAAKQINNLEFYAGRLSGKSLVLVRCGIGKVNAAVCTQILISQFGADYIINTGIAGAVYKDLEIGDIVISKNALQHDVDVTAFGVPAGVIPRMKESIFAADECLIQTALKAYESLKLKHKIYVGTIASGDQFVSSGEKKNFIWNQFKAYCVEMEGAAIAHTCYLNSIPFVVIRSISDKADQKADVSYEEFSKSAAKTSSMLVEQIVELL